MSCFQSLWNDAAVGGSGLQLPDALWSGLVKSESGSRSEKLPNKCHRLPEGPQCLQRRKGTIYLNFKKSFTPFLVSQLCVRLLDIGPEWDLLHQLGVHILQVNIEFFAFYMWNFKNWKYFCTAGRLVVAAPHHLEFAAFLRKPVTEAPCRRTWLTSHPRHGEEMLFYNITLQSSNFESPSGHLGLPAN